MAETAATSEPCSQCQKPGIAAVNVMPLCVDCFYKFEVARTLGLRIAAIGMNHAAAQLDHMSGLPTFTPRMQVPERADHLEQYQD